MGDVVPVNCIENLIGRLYHPVQIGCDLDVGIGKGITFIGADDEPSFFPEKVDHHTSYASKASCY
jgi:hypothetical protein